MSVFEERDSESKATKPGSQGLSGEGEDEFIDDDEALLNDPEFRNAFNGHPSKHTPNAIVMFLTWKCFHQGNGISTAQGIHAAFIAEYDQL